MTFGAFGSLGGHFWVTLGRFGALCGHFCVTLGPMHQKSEKVGARRGKKREKGLLFEALFRQIRQNKHKS